MTAQERIDPNLISSVVRTLVELFRELHPHSEPRLVRTEESGTVTVLPSAAHTDPAEFEDHALHAVGPARFTLQLRRGSVPASESERLIEALNRAIDYEREARSSAQELSERYEEINLLYSISEIIGSVRTFDAAAARILTEVMDVLSARRASLWVYRQETESLELVAAVGEEGLRGPIRVRDSDSATAWVFRERQAMNVERVPGNEPRGTGPRPRSHEPFLSVPINFTPPDGASRTVGVLTLIGRRSDAAFTTAEERLLSAIASQIGAAVESQRLLEESLKRERVLRELELAHDLQLKLLPDTERFDGPPEVAARCVPAESVGGDFYQLYRLSNNRVGLMIGDVSSHGFSAALIMALTTSAIGIYAKEEETPGEVLRRVHRALIKELESTEMYLSLFYSVLDPGAGALAYANAGHPQAYRLDANGQLARLGATGPPLGVSTVEPYGQRVAPWNPGDLLILFTDGLSDCLADRPGIAAGEARLVEIVRQGRNGPLPVAIAAVFDESERAPAGTIDDRTLLLVRA
jgi:sigma-B regulation protein RsbU (phosphoserine phosphatase)